MAGVRFWVPMAEVAVALDGLAGAEVQVAAPGEGHLPDGADDVEFYVPPFFPPTAAITAMARMPRLKVVQTLTAGIERFQPHVPPGVVLCNARGVHDASTAEWVVGVILASLRELPHFAAEQASRRWSFKFTDCLAGKNVLIVGYGSIGRAVEARLAGFEVQVSRVARSAREGVAPVSDLPGMLPRADVVILLVPVTPDTVGMVDSAFLAAMKDGALLVNAARGTVAVTAALTRELSNGRIRAALDVTDPEPLPEDQLLWGLPNVVITPHVAASTPVSVARALSFLRAQAERYCRGEPLVNVVTATY